jgi:hydrogenase maturation protein HypF
MTLTDETRAVRVGVRGVVQGVGFRPFVYRLAHAEGVRGWVLNGPAGVSLHAEGAAEAVDRFLERLRSEAPAAATVASCEVTPAAVEGLARFEIRHSEERGAPTARISPDLCVCEACASEMREAGDHRFGYAYINCTNCGPRYSIIRDLPYDRATTTMRAWDLCARCAEQYADPLDRRFHAQPVACPACGPGYRLVAGGRTLCRDGEAIARAASMLREGGIVAVKGIGGYHLACDARNPGAVRALRERKFRKEKPFALMVGTLEEARSLVQMEDAHERLLTSVARPIVLAVARVDLSWVAPGNDSLGVMLPSTPLHLLLFDEGAPRTLVMTSANRSSEPIAYEDADAFVRLDGIADAFLVGERPIARRVDDSVISVDRVGGRTQPFMIRRSRGYAPLPVASLESDRPILAVGADLKNAIALVVRGEVFVSQHIGDLGEAETDRAFRETAEDLLRMYGVKRRDLLVAHDLHPEYVSTRSAMAFDAAERVGVQHHRAHVASVLTEHGLFDERVVGVALDGTGLGDDGAIWGGEFFVGSLRGGLERVGSIRPASMPGGDAAARHPAQALAGYLHTEEGVAALLAAPVEMPRRYFDAVQMVRHGVRCFETTSAGRLFDAAAAVCGFVRPISFEGQAAIWLEQAARLASGSPDPVRDPSLDPAGLLLALIAHRTAGVGVREAALWFHRSLAASVAARATGLAAEHACGTVALTGGVFQNDLLLSGVARLVEDAGLRAVVNRSVPANDGGICLGQAALASV